MGINHGERIETSDRLIPFGMGFPSIGRSIYGGFGLRTRYINPWYGGAILPATGRCISPCLFTLKQCLGDTSIDLHSSTRWGTQQEPPTTFSV
jgi:hypothetical protein